jgi:rod shape-determining protein MreC
VVSTLVYPLQSVVSFPVEFAENMNETMASYSALKKENALLKEKQMINNVRLLKFSALENENIRLRGLLENSFEIGEQVLSAELLSVNLVPYEHVVVINKGTSFGVFSHQPALDSNGIVGQVLRALPLSSEVMLITDPSHAIPVQINRNGLRTIAIGSGQLDRINLPFLPNNADILPGDLLVTSGLGGVFPQGYPVATVEKFIVQPSKPFANIYAKPLAELDRIRELLVVWSDSTPIPLSRSLPSSSPSSPPPPPSPSPLSSPSSSGRADAIGKMNSQQVSE